MTRHSENQVAVTELINRLCNGEMTAPDVTRLNHLLATDDAALLCYIEYLDIEAQLSCYAAMPVKQSDTLSYDGLNAPYPSEATGYPVIDRLDEVPRGAFIHRSADILFSYTVAAALSILLLLAFSLITISRAVRNDITPVPPDNGAIAIQTNKAPLGAITNMANCQGRRWSAADRKSEGGKSLIPNPQSPIPVFLGDRFVLSSGLMEITYDTGAKVILQAPCTYEIDSPRSGYLAVGKLTALVEKKADVSNPQSRIPHPLFAVRTPTAIVTDLGTEFGVEVEQSGATRSHVFQGSISIVPSPNGRGTSGKGNGEPTEILHANQSARVERGRNNKVAITRESGQPNRFIRRIPSSSIPRPSSLSKSPPPSDPRPLPPLYRFTDLGTLGGQNSRAQAINVYGQIVGKADTADGAEHGFLYFEGKMKDLGSINGGNSSANSINAHGKIVGSLTDRQTGVSSAFLYSNAVMRELGTLGGASACAYAINDDGTVVGVSNNPNKVRRAFLYEPSVGMKDLGSIGGSHASSSAMDVNAAGQVTGYSETRTGAIHAFLYEKTRGMIDLGAAGGAGSFGCRINDNGRIVGSRLLDGRISRAYVFGNRNHDLGTLGGRTSTAFGINKIGQIVGDAEVNDRGTAVAYAFLYSNGRMHDLNRLVDLPRGWVLTRAVAINDSGRIVGYGTAPDGNQKAFLLTPVKGTGG